MEETPHSLLARLREHPSDSDAWQRLLDLYTPFLARWIERLSSLQAHDIEDVVQNVLTVVARKLPGFDHNQHAGAFRKWLKAILVNCLKEHYRAEPPRAVEVQLAELVAPDSELSQHFDEEHRMHLVRKLVEIARPRFPPEQWSVFQAHVLEGQAAEQVAKANGVSLNVVYLTKSRVVKWLREEGRGLIDDDELP